MIDAEVLAHGGIVGKHAGDGVTAFFLADQVGSASGAATAAIRVARELVAAVERIEQDEELPVQAGELEVNIGLHWGEQLFMGQLVTGGRLEVTALGDEVKRGGADRQTARQGAQLVSKVLVEQLDPDDAEAVGLDPATARYVPLKAVEGAAEKAIRDAGAVPVTQI